MRPRVALTLGDPRGIGPEIVGKVLADPPAGADYVVVGPAGQVAEWSRDRGTAEPAEQLVALSTDPQVDLSAAQAGKLVAAQLETAVSLATHGEAHAIVTAPVEKRALHAAGYRYPGLTEWLGTLAGGAETVMMLVAGKLRVALVTTHVPLRDAIRSVTTERIVQVGEQVKRALERWWGIRTVRLAVCALNPHASEGGLFGTEEATVLTPAVRQLGAVGPLPADTVFVRAMKGEFDAVLAPYHDVGMTAVKVAGFGRGVNVTLGLPFVRTAPDHGTAFDIAGKGIADPCSMKEAVRLAIELASRELAI